MVRAAHARSRSVRSRGSRATFEQVADVALGGRSPRNPGTIGRGTAPCREAPRDRDSCRATGMPTAHAPPASSGTDSHSSADRPSSGTTAARPARLSETDCISGNGCEPVSRYCPGSRRRSTRALMSRSSPGAYWISSSITGGRCVSRIQSPAAGLRKRRRVLARVQRRRTGAPERTAPAGRLAHPPGTREHHDRRTSPPSAATRDPARAESTCPAIP